MWSLSLYRQAIDDFLREARVKTIYESSGSLSSNARLECTACDWRISIDDDAFDLGVLRCPICGSDTALNSDDREVRSE